MTPVQSSFYLRSVKKAIEQKKKGEPVWSGRGPWRASIHDATSKVVTATEIYRRRLCKCRPVPALRGRPLSVPILAMNSSKRQHVSILPSASYGALFWASNPRHSSRIRDSFRSPNSWCFDTSVSENGRPSCSERLSHDTFPSFRSAGTGFLQRGICAAKIMTKHAGKI